MSNIFLKVKGRGGQYVHDPFTQCNHNNNIVIKGLTDLHKKRKRKYHPLLNNNVLLT